MADIGSYYTGPEGNYESPLCGYVLDSDFSGQIMVAMKGLGECELAPMLIRLPDSDYFRA